LNARDEEIGELEKKKGRGGVEEGNEETGDRGKRDVGEGEKKRDIGEGEMVRGREWEKGTAKGTWKGRGPK
jgi:hypothetical protein